MDLNPRLQRVSKWEGAMSVPPDLDFSCAALMVACLARGRSRLHPWPTDGIYAAVVERVRLLGIPVEQDEDGLWIEGQGLQFVPAIEHLKSGISCPNWDVLELTWLSFHFPKASIPNNKHGVDLGLIRHVLPWFDWQIENSELKWDLKQSRPESETALIQLLGWRGLAKQLPAWKATQVLLRNGWILSGVLHQVDWTWEAESALRDPWTNLWKSAGLAMTQEKAGLDLEGLDEIERRMLKMRGFKAEKKVRWQGQPTSVLKPIQVSIPGDVSCAAYLTAMALLTPSSHLEIPGVWASVDRAGWFACVRRLGANVDWSSKKDRQGETHGTLKVKTTRQWQARKLSGDQVLSQGMEFPILIALCASIPEETIIRDLPDFWRLAPEREKRWIDQLRQASVDLGDYEEGLVVRGREHPDGGLCEAVDPMDVFAAGVWAARALGGVEVANFAIVHDWWPTWVRGLPQFSSHREEPLLSEDQ
jgi:5-enolpyruvylshikimate-3-phosphate synthase